MSALAPVLQAFFVERMIGQRRASPCTITAYRNTFRLLLCFAQQRTGKPPCQLLGASGVLVFASRLKISSASAAESGTMGILGRILDSASGIRRAVSVDAHPGVKGSPGTRKSYTTAPR